MRRFVQCDAGLQATKRSTTEPTSPGYDMSPVVVVFRKQEGRNSDRYFQRFSRRAEIS